MELQISILSDDKDYALSEARQLKKDFNFYAPQVKVKQLEQPLKGDDAAISIMDVVVQVFLGKEFINNVVGVIKSYIEKRAEVINAKKSKIQFDIKDEKGKTISVVLENVKDAEKFLEHLKNL